MMILLILFVLTIASIVYLATDHRQAEAMFCKIECIEHQAKAPRSY